MHLNANLTTFNYGEKVMKSSFIQGVSKLIMQTSGYIVQWVESNVNHYLTNGGQEGEGVLFVY